MAIFEDIGKRMRNFDVFPKTMEDFKVRTKSGGLVSIAAYVLMITLSVLLLNDYLALQKETKLVVDNSRGEPISIYVDILFPEISCNLIGIDALDATGTAQLEIANDIFKIRTDENGIPVPAAKATKAHSLKNMKTTEDGSPPPGYCGSCYGAKAVGCCNTCDEVKEAYEQHNWLLIDLDNIEQCVREGAAGDNKLVENEGCLVKGKVDVAKVAGNFHIAPGHSFDVRGRHLHDVGAFHHNKLNLTHKINQLSFGATFPGQKNPLDNTEKILGETDKLGMHEYFVKIVPTSYEHYKAEVISSNQYSATQYFRPGDPAVDARVLPGVFFYYEMSPIKVVVREYRKALLPCILQLFAIVGGIFSTMGMVDASFYHGGKVIRKKLQVGKAD